MKISNASKLTLEQRAQIPLLYAQGKSSSELSIKYGVHYKTILQYVDRKESAKKLKRVEQFAPFIKLTRAEATSIISQYLQGQKTQKEIAKEFNIDQSTVSNICTGKSWKHLFQGLRRKYNKESIKIARNNN